MNAILVHISRVNLEEYGAKVNTVRSSPVNLVGAGQYKKCVLQNIVIVRKQSLKHLKEQKDLKNLLKLSTKKFVLLG